MKNEMLEIGSAIYNGVCIYNRLSKSIVEIEGKFVSLEDKIELGLYLGLLHTQNTISNLLNETELKNNTKIDYKKLDSKEYCNLYNTIFKDIMDNMNLETIEEYFNTLLSKDIVIKLNREYNFNSEEFFNSGNKQMK